jgi:hypothetical protein
MTPPLGQSHPFLVGQGCRPGEVETPLADPKAIGACCLPSDDAGASDGAAAEDSTASDAQDVLVESPTDSADGEASTDSGADRLATDVTADVPGQ